MKKEKKDLGEIGFTMFYTSVKLTIFAALLGIIVMVFKFYNYFILNIYIVLAIAVAILMIGAVILSFLDKKLAQKAHIENMETFQWEYDKYTEQLGIVKSKHQATLIDPHRYDSSIPQYLWIDDDILNIFPMVDYYKFYATSCDEKPDVSELELRKISTDSILYFEEVGELRKYAVVSGGGSSLKGAMLGYMIADDAGAIIGSREPITTRVVSEDDRIVELIYKNPDGEIENLEFTHDAYAVLKKLIPSKEFRRIVNLKASLQENHSSKTKKQGSQSAKEKLKNLNELKQEGLLTEEEYAEQKQKILNSL